MIPDGPFLEQALRRGFLDSCAALGV